MRKKLVSLMSDPEWVEYLVYEFFLVRIPLRAPNAPMRVESTKAFAKRFMAKPPEWFEEELKRHREANSSSTEFVDAIASRLREHGREEFPNLLEKPAGPYSD